jgi:hypothetical protein
VRRVRRDEAGQAGMEVIPFGILTFAVGALLVANAWAVVDAKMAVSAAAREATRAYVEAPDDAAAEAAALVAAREAIAGVGRDGHSVVVRRLEGDFVRCATVRYEASYHIPAVRLPWVGGFGDFTVVASHAEIVDPYRTGVPAATAGCGTAP